MPQRLLIFGGTFDPPHLAHTRLPAIVADQLGCGRILYIPAAMSPHKTESPAADRHRLAMLALALADVPKAEICATEIERAGPSYTCDTLEALRGKLGRDAELFFLMGADQVLVFHDWKNWRRILQLATPAVMLRPPMDEATFRRRLRETYDEAEAARWLGRLVRVPLMDMSATSIRQRLAAGGSVNGLLDPAVAEYIRKHDLYT